MPVGAIGGVGLQEAMNSSVVASSKTRKDYVMYKRQKHFLSEVLFYVKYEDRTYAVLPVDEITVTQNEQPKELQMIGHVYKARSGENDLTDTPETASAQKYNVYKSKKTLYVQLPKGESICAPMVKVN